MALNKNSISYTIIYCAVLVIAVAVGLSIVYQSLRPAQEKNIADDKKRQILSSIRISPEKGENVADVYDRYITESFLVNFNGKRTDSATDPFAVDVAAQVKLDDNKRLLPVFEAKTKDGAKYIIPVYGAGLWGPIWGYVAFDDNGDTIYGAYFSHQGETPGLGAEIEKPQFQDQFQGKNVFCDGNFTSIAVEKAGQKPAQGDYVNAISGGTITSKGVQTMLENSLRPYQAFLFSLQEQKNPVKSN